MYIYLSLSRRLHFTVCPLGSACCTPIKTEDPPSFAFFIQVRDHLDQTRAGRGSGGSLATRGPQKVSFAVLQLLPVVSAKCSA